MESFGLGPYFRSSLVEQYCVQALCSNGKFALLSSSQSVRLHPSPGDLPHEVEDALLAMGTLRARAGPPLTIYISQCIDEEQVQRWNSLLGVLRRNVGKTHQNRVAFHRVSHGGW